MHRPSGLETTARIGYTARGVVYLIIGTFAGLAAIGGWRAGGTKDALERVLAQPFGGALLAIVAAGLLCFAAWRMAQAFLDADHHGDTPSGLIRRAVLAANGVFYIGLAAWTVTVMLAINAATDSDQEARDWTAWLLAKPLGHWLVIALGMAVAITGIAIAIKGVRGHFERRLDLGIDSRRWLVPLGRYGHLARGFVFVLIGAFLVVAAIHSNPQEVKGLGGAFRTLQEQPYGSLLLAVSAVGFLAFGAYEVAQAAYRRLRAPTMHDIAVQSRR